jgi:CDGSH-type Zn-finger protein
VVSGDIPLVRKEQVVSEYCEPLTWKKTCEIPTNGEYWLCRCGHSMDKPFCDGSHALEGFNGQETADTGTFDDRAFTYNNGTGIVMRKDPTLCMQSGFCGNRVTNVAKMISSTKNTQVRAQLIAMIERCPAGALTYSIKPGEPDIEPDLPGQVAITTEITNDGPIPGPLWVTGEIAIQRSDGQPMEVRNRVTLCNCGESHHKPLCDGTHRYQAERKKKEKSPSSIFD